MIKSLGNIITTNWTSEAYGFGKWLRLYGYYPNALPLCILCEHSGPNFQHLHSGVPIYDLKFKNYIYFTHSEYKKRQWFQITGKKSYIIPNPFKFYLEKTGYKRNSDVKGTIVYPMHTVPQVNYKIDIKKFSEELKLLPQEFHPIVISLHHHDMLIGLDKDWENEGYKVVSAGDPFGENFIEIFFSILNSFKVAISNYPGSYTFYSVLLGVPFYLYGSENIDKIGYHDEVLEKTGVEQDTGFDFFSISEIPRLSSYNFYEISEIIPDTLKRYTEEMLNYDNRISRIHFSYILYSQFLIAFARMIRNKLILQYNRLLSKFIKS